MSVTEAPGFYTDLAAIWFLCGLLGAGFYMAYGKEAMKGMKGIGKNRRRKVLTGMFLTALVLGPLSIAASFVDMLRRKHWYGWTLW